MSVSEVGWRIPEWNMADRMRKSRLSLGVSQAQMSEILGISKNTVSSYENGHHKPLGVILKQWALATGVPVEWIKNGVMPGGGPDNGGELLPHLDSNQEPFGYQLAA